MKFKSIFKKDEPKAELPKVDREKYKALYEYQKAQLEDEKNRFGKLEDKAAKYLTALTVAITAYVLIVRWVFEWKITPEYQYFLLVKIAISNTFFLFCIAWGFILSSIKLRSVAKMSSDESLINFFKEKKLESVYLTLAKNYSQIISRYRIENEKKTDLMIWGYRFTIGAGISFMISMILIFFYKMA
ncbi:hypothetical protein [Acinetobacter baumannii]|uniref:hypothetical protein n=1 Tax=Acinetobacter baumannii TaxID=470 RepID=UPI00389134F0